MGKYDDLIGGFKVTIDVEEVLNEEAAKKVDDRIKKQKAELEKPIEINVKSNKAENQLKALTKAAKKVQDNLQKAIDLQQGFDVINEHITGYNRLKKQIKDVSGSVDKNNAALKDGNKILKDTKKLIDQLTVSQDKFNKTKKTKSKSSAADTVQPTKEIDTVAQKAAKTKVDAQKQVNFELEKEEEILKRIEAQEKKNEAAREKLKKKQTNYGKIALGTDKAVIDIDKLNYATQELKNFNTELEKRNQFQEKYNKLRGIVEKSFIGQHGAAGMVWGDMDQFIADNKAMKSLEQLSKKGIKGWPTKQINGRFKEVVNYLKRETRLTQGLIDDGTYIGVHVEHDLEKEEIELYQEMQRLYDERIAQENKITALKREELDLIKQIGQEEAKNQKKTQKNTKTSKYKVREFASMDEYLSLQEKYQNEHDGENEYLEDVVDVVHRINQISADMITSCKKAETAAKRFFSALDPQKYPRLAEWQPFFEEAMKNGIFKQIDAEAGWSWEVQALDDDTYYVNLIAVADIQEKVIEQAGEVKNKLLETTNTSIKTEIIDEDELEIIKKENGALEDKLELLQDIAEQYANNISQRDRNRFEQLNQKDMNDGLSSREEERYWELGEAIDEADRQIDEFGQTYERIILKLGNGKKIEILPDDAGLKKFDKIVSEYYQGEYNGIEIEDVIFERVKTTTEALVEQAKATEKLAEANKKLGGAVTSTPVDKEQLEKKAKDLKRIIAVQNEWIEYLDRALNKDNFKATGKRDATEKLKDITLTLWRHKKENYENYWGEYPKEMLDVKWMHQYQEAQRQGVAQSTLNRYDVWSAETGYETSLAKLQSVYEQSQKLIETSTAELKIIEAQIAAQEQLTAEVQKTTEARLKFTKKDGSDNYTAMDGKYAIDKLNEVVPGSSVKKQDTSLADNMRRMNVLSEFTQSNSELIRQFFDTEQYDVFVKKVEEISNSILKTGLSLEEANKQLQEFVGGLEKSREMTGQAQAIEKLPQLVDNYGKSLDEANNKLMQGTRLLNEQGQILRLFHNSSEIFDKFDATKAGSNQGQVLGKGNYLALSQNGEFNGLDYGRYQTQWYANVQNPFNVRDRLTDKQSAEVIDKFLGDRAEGFKQHMLGKLLDGDVVEAVKDIAYESKTTVGEIFGHLGYDAIMDGAQINVFDPSKIHRANASVLDIGTGDFDVFRDLQKQIWEEQKIVNNANNQIKKLSNQYAGQTKEQLDSALLGELLLRSWNWRESVAKIASELKELTGELPKADGISEESMRAMVENYEFSKQNLQSYIDEKEKHQKIISQLENKWLEQEKKIHAATQYYLKGDIVGVANKEASKETTVQAEATQNVLDTESKLTPVIKANIEAKQEQVEQAKAHLDAEKKVTVEIEKQQDVMQQALWEEIVDDNTIKYESPYSSEQISKLSRGAGINKILEEYGVSKSDRGQIKQEIEQFVSMIAEKQQFESLGIESTDDLPSMINEAMANVIDMIHKHGSRKVPKVEQDLLEAFYDYLQGIQIGYSDTEAAEFGDEWSDKIKKFGTGQYKILTKDPSAHGIDGIWDEFMDKFSGLLTEEERQESEATQNHLRAFLRIAEKARELHADKSKTTIQALSDEDYDNIATAINSVVNIVEKNAQRMFSTGSNVSVEEIVSREIDSALEQLRTAKNNETTLFSLKGVFDGEELVQQARDMIDNIAEQANLSLASFNVKDDTIKVKLYNDELKVTVDQIYKLKAVTEEMESSQLQLVSQSFSQNVKALNENNFDVEGMQARALAAIEKTRASLHGLEYDLTGLEDAAKNITSQDDFTKFNNQLKAAEDNIQAIKNSTVSKNSMNPLANMQRDMKNASIEIETMRLKLEKFGDLKGVSEAQKMLSDMTESANKYNEAINAQEQQSAYNKYSETRSSFKAQMEYINAAKALNDSQQSTQKQTDPIREQYQSILDLVNKINAKSSEITKYQSKDGGTGLFAGYISQLQSEKEKLVSELKGITNEIDNTFTTFVPGKEVSVPFASFLNGSETISNFLNDIRVQASLTSEEIERLVTALQKSQNIDVNAAAKVTEQFKSVQETYKRLSNLTGLDQSSESYQSLVGVFKQIMQYKDKLSADPTSWSPEESAQLQSLIDTFTKYGNALADVGEKEARYFANKQRFSEHKLIGDSVNTAEQEAKKVLDIQKQLEDAARKIAESKKLGAPLITNFEQSADGISRLDFSAFEQATRTLRTFRVEMGSVTEGIHYSENTISRSLKNIQAANKQIQSINELKIRLGAAGVDTSEDGATQKVKELLSVYNDLQNELNKGDAADQSEITRLTKNSKLAASEVEKLYKQMLQMESAIASGDAKNLGVGDPTKNVYDQLVNSAKEYIGVGQNATLEIGRFDAKTKTLDVSLVHANGAVENFKVSMNGLSGQMAAQQAGVGKLTSTWDRFKSSIAGAGKQLMTAFAGYNVFYKAIAEVRKGIGYVKEIDLALTELKKVTDETEESYRNFLNTAASSAGKIGSTVSDFTEATANFARLGYTMEESADMAQTAIVYRNVADGLDTVEEATDSIISTMKAFGIESDNTMRIIDVFNEVGEYVAQTI